MSLLNNNNKKDKKKNQQQRNNPGFPSPKGKTNSKAISKNTKLTGGFSAGFLTEISLFIQANLSSSSRHWTLSCNLQDYPSINSG